MEAAYNLGLIYEIGLLGKPQREESLVWYKTAADKGITSMEKELGRAVDMKEVKQRLIASIETVYGVSVV